jgi:hypothetical protein
MGQLSISDILVENSDAPIDSVAVDMMKVKKAEKRMKNIKIKEVIAFFLILFFPFNMLAEDVFGGGKAWN